MNADEKVFGVLPLALQLVCVGTNNSYALKREKSYKSNLLRYIPRFYWVLRNKLPPLLISRLPILVRLILSKYHAEWDNKNYLFWQQPQQHNINNIAQQSYSEEDRSNECEISNNRSSPRRDKNSLPRSRSSLYNIVLPYLRHYGAFVPKIG